MSESTQPSETTPAPSAAPAPVDTALNAVQAELTALQGEIATLRAANQELEDKLTAPAAPNPSEAELVQLTGRISGLIEKYKALRDSRYSAEGQMRSNGQVANANAAHAQGDEADSFVNDLIALLPSA